jgi:hypothetical protein
MWNFESFDKSRDQNESLKTIESKIKRETKENLSSLKIGIQLTNSLHNWLKIVSWDELHHVNHIMNRANWESHGNRNGKDYIKWYDGVLDKSDEANRIWTWDIVKIEGKKVYRTHNGKKVVVGEVINWFGIQAKSENSKSGKIEDGKWKESEKKVLLYASVDKANSDLLQMMKKKSLSNGEIAELEVSMGAYNKQYEELKAIIGSSGTYKNFKYLRTPELNKEMIRLYRERNEINTKKEEKKEGESKGLEEFEKIWTKDLEKAFNAFKDTIERIDTFTDTQSSSEKIGNKDLLDTNYNALIILVQVIEKQKNIAPELKNKIDETKLYLAKYYADEWETENSNFRNYKLSNQLAFEVLWDIEWLVPPPKPPEMWDIIWSFKGTWIWTYIVSKIKEWEKTSNIFSSKIVKDASEEKWEELIGIYENELEKYLESIDKNNRKWLTWIQQNALDLLMDVNWAWWSVKNTTTEKWDIMWWDFGAIWAWIWAWMWAGALVGSLIPWVWTLTVWTAWAIAWGITTTLWMMVNHWDNYFWEDWKKWGIELWINTAMFWAWWALFKWARSIQWWSKLLSKWGLTALWVEAGGDVAIWVSMDMTRWVAYGMNIELWDAIVNNLVWALLPITLRWKQGFSEIRRKLAKNVSEWQKKASILARLWDKPWAKKIIEWLNKETKRIKELLGKTAKKVSWEMDRVKQLVKKIKNKNWETKVQPKEGNKTKVGAKQDASTVNKEAKIQDSPEIQALQEKIYKQDKLIELNQELRNDVKRGGQRSSNKWGGVQKGIKTNVRHLEQDGKRLKRELKGFTIQMEKLKNKRGGTKKWKETNKWENVKEWKAKENITEISRTIWKKYLNNNIDDFANQKIKNIKPWESIKIWDFEVARSIDGKAYKVGNKNFTDYKKVGEHIKQNLNTPEKQLKFLKEINHVKLKNHIENLKGKKINNDYYFDKKNTLWITDKFGKKVEFNNLEPNLQKIIIEKITWNKLTPIIENAWWTFTSMLTKEGRQKLKNNWWKKGFESEFLKNTWDKTKKWAKEDWSTVKQGWVIKLPISLLRVALRNTKRVVWDWAVRQGVWPTFKWAHGVLTNWSGIGWVPILKGLKAWPTSWKQRLAWWVALSATWEMYHNDDSKSLWEQTTNALFNGLMISWGLLPWYIFSAMADTAVWQISWLEQRDILPSLINNLLPWNTPYALTWVAFRDRKTNLEKTIKAYREGWYSESDIAPLVKELEEIKKQNKLK